MQLSRNLDAIVAGAIALLLPSVVLFLGDPIYVGIWYYFAVPTVALGLAAAFRVKPPFLIGTSLAVAITLLAYMSINWRATHPEGLLALGHLFSLPGASIGIIVGAIISKRIQHPLVVLLFGFFGMTSGFLINQFILCNTVMWCGALSMEIKPG